jgi:hypothetical protein
MVDAVKKITLIFLILLVGCTFVPARTLVPSTSPKFSFTPTADISSSQTLVITETPLKTEIPEPTQSVTPMLTPIPTPAGADAKSKVAYLLKTNGNCSLPCWWGITPGRTTWSEANTYLAVFALEITHPSSPQPENLTFYPSEFPDPNSNSPDGFLFASFAVNNSGIIEIIDSFAKTSLASMLNAIGVPSQIRINIVTIGPGPYEYTLILFYDSGIMVVYHGTTFIGDSNYVYICPDDIPKASSQLWVWDAASIHGFENIGKFGVLPPLTPLDRFPPLNELNKMQPQSFYDYYSNPSATQCIKTPWAYWF